MSGRCCCSSRTGSCSTASARIRTRPSWPSPERVEADRRRDGRAEDTYEPGAWKPCLTKMARASADAIASSTGFASGLARRVNAAGYTIRGWVPSGNVPTTRTPGSATTSGRVDDAQRRLAAGDEGERGAHVVRWREARRHAVPHAEGGQRGLAVASGRHVHGIGDGQASTGAERRGEREAGADGQRRHPILRCDQHQPVPDHVHARRARNPRPLGQVVHPLLVGREEDVGRRALFDLPGEERRPRIGRLQRHTGPLGDECADLVQRALQADGGEDEHRPRRLRVRRRRDHQNRNNKRPQCPHPTIIVGSSCNQL